MPPHRGSVEISRGRGVEKVKVLKQMYGAIMTFWEGWGMVGGGGGRCNPKDPPSVEGGGGMDIFWNHAILG